MTKCFTVETAVTAIPTSAKAPRARRSPSISCRDRNSFSPCLLMSLLPISDTFSLSFSLSLCLCGCLFGYVWLSKRRHTALCLYDSCCVLFPFGSALIPREPSLTAVATSCLSASFCAPASCLRIFPPSQMCYICMWCTPLKGSCHSVSASFLLCLFCFSALLFLFPWLCQWTLRVRTAACLRSGGDSVSPRRREQSHRRRRLGPQRRSCRRGQSLPPEKRGQSARKGDAHRHTRHTPYRLYPGNRTARGG